MNRNKLVIRRISGSGKAFKSDVVETIKTYIDSVQSIILNGNYGPAEILNFDESSFYMDSVGNYSVSTRGARKVYARTTGKEKVRLSCLMTSSASGYKFPILCVVPRKKKIQDIEENPNIIIIYENKGLLNKLLKQLTCI